MDHSLCVCVCVCVCVRVCACVCVCKCCTGKAYSTVSYNTIIQCELKTSLSLSLPHWSCRGGEESSFGGVEGDVDHEHPNLLIDRSLR